MSDKAVCTRVDLGERFGGLKVCLMGFAVTVAHHQPPIDRDRVPERCHTVRDVYEVFANADRDETDGGVEDV